MVLKFIVQLVLINEIRQNSREKSEVVAFCEIPWQVAFLIFLFSF